MTNNDLGAFTRSAGFTAYPPIPSQYDGAVSAYESSAASGPHIWVKSTATTGRAHLSADNAWLLARHLAALVVHHYQGDARPDISVAATHDTVCEMLGISDADADALLAALAIRGLVLINVGQPAGDGAQDGAPR